MGLVWTKRLSVGNAVIDSEHRNLISMTRDVRHEIRWGDAVSVLRAFDMLESWLRVHFANEEKIAQAIRFPFDNHRSAQRRLLKEFRQMRKDLAAANVPWSNGAIKYFSRHMKNWIIDMHIVEWDMRMKPALQPLGYGFLPGGEDNAAHQTRKKEANKPPTLPRKAGVRNGYLLTPPALPFNCQENGLAFSFTGEND